MATHEARLLQADQGAGAQEFARPCGPLWRPLLLDWRACGGGAAVLAARRHPWRIGVEPSTLHSQYAKPVDKLLPNRLRSTGFALFVARRPAFVRAPIRSLLHAQHDQRFIETSGVQLVASGLSWDRVELTAEERQVAMSSPDGEPIKSPIKSPGATAQPPQPHFACDEHVLGEVLGGASAGAIAIDRLTWIWTCWNATRAAEDAR